MTKVFAAVVVAACCAAAALPALAAKRPRYLWATVNICDTPDHADMMGIRPSIPGDGDRTRMYMRFAAEYYDATRQAWTPYRTSSWVYVGSGIYRWRQGG